MAQMDRNVFQLTSSRRGWHNSYCLALGVPYISTHILTKRMTRICVWQVSSEDIISTHILTKRMTHFRFRKPQVFHYFNSHPHEEDDKNPLILLITPLTFQLTSSRRGWQIYCTIHNINMFISTHILTKRMTAILNKNNLFKIAYYINNKHFISIVDIFFHFHIYF